MDNSKMNGFLLATVERLKQPSSWVALGGVWAYFGWNHIPFEYVVELGVALCGILGFILKERTTSTQVAKAIAMAKPEQIAQISQAVEKGDTLVRQIRAETGESQAVMDAALVPTTRSKP